jgi:hypothetical protein
MNIPKDIVRSPVVVKSVTTDSLYRSEYVVRSLRSQQE